MDKQQFQSQIFTLVEQMKQVISIAVGKYGIDQYELNQVMQDAIFEIVASNNFAYDYEVIGLLEKIKQRIHMQNVGISSNN